MDDNGNILDNIFPLKEYGYPRSLKEYGYPKRESFFMIFEDSKQN